MTMAPIDKPSALGLLEMWQFRLQAEVLRECRHNGWYLLLLAMLLGLVLTSHRSINQCHNRHHVGKFVCVRRFCEFLQLIVHDVYKSFDEPRSVSAVTPGIVTYTAITKYQNNICSEKISYWQTMRIKTLLFHSILKATIMIQTDRCKQIKKTHLELWSKQRGSPVLQHTDMSWWEQLTFVQRTRTSRPCQSPRRHNAYLLSPVSPDCHHCRRNTNCPVN